MEKFPIYQIVFAFAGVAQSVFGAWGDPMNPWLATIWVAAALALFASPLWKSECATRHGSLRVAMILGAIMILGAAYSIFDRKQFDISFEIGPNLIRSDYKWMRFEVYDDSRKEAVCRAYITKISKAGRVIVQVTEPLQAADLGDGDKFQPVTVGAQHSIGRSFDILYVSKNNDYMQVASYPHFDDLYPHKQFTSGKYEFDISVGGTNCISSPEKLLIDYRGGVDISVTKLQ